MAINKSIIDSSSQGIVTQNASILSSHVPQHYNLYCDESCHLPNDGSKIMVLGGIWCPKGKVRKINEHIRKIKTEYGVQAEIKWVKLSSSKKELYNELINYFFDNDDLHFRVLIVDNKDQLDNQSFHQTHDEWYYKMYFNMIKTVIDPKAFYSIYLDIKDTKSKTKIQKLNEVLSNSRYTISNQTIQKIQVIRSDEVEIMQIVDVLIGAIAYKLRGYEKSAAKKEMIQLIEQKSNYQMEGNTLYREDKFNIFHLQLQEADN